MQKKQSRLTSLFEGTQAMIDRIFENPFKKIGISWLDLKFLKYFPKKDLQMHVLFGKPTYFHSAKEYVSGLREIFADELYLQNLPANSYIIDCGANIGLSVIYLKKLCPAAVIVAFEPDPQNFKVLKKNISSHNLSLVDLKNEAVWTSNTTLDFVADGDMGSKIRAGKDGTVEVQAVRLRDFLNQKVNFLKIDIEGVEFEVIKDIQDKLSMVQNLFIEYHGSFQQNTELNQIFKIVVDNGFNYYIKEATSVYKYPFLRNVQDKPYDIQLNIFCFKN